ncbi:MAG: precorrin-6y C5,15-methyltransferase (decarboxylating) subunit CbiE [Nocardioides sp.]|nr:precorrin-6y C5,15-methyltransferase (decarboxylating) subunit CbiE [Nocardioides sp.]
MPSSRPAHVTVVGLGADGWSGLSEPTRARVRNAAVLVGGQRHLGLVPEVHGQTREPWPSPLRDGLVELMERHAGVQLVVLASGDPMVSGIGSTLAEVFGADFSEVIPAISSVSLARARMRWSADSTEVVRLVGRDPDAVLRHLAPAHRLLVLSSDEGTAAVVAALLVARGYGDSQMTVLGDLGSADETRVEATAATWGAAVSRLNVIALDLRGPVIGSWATGLRDEDFEHDGQLTKRDLRASALARLAPQPGQLLWDIGAGAGSVGIEWMRAHPTCRTVAIEADPVRAARISRNAASLGVPALRVVHARAPESFDGLPAPDAVFVGGGATRPGVVTGSLTRLAPGGRLVVHGVTFETETLLARLYAQHGGELTRIAVEHAAPIGAFTGWTPARAVTQWAVTA